MLIFCPSCRTEFSVADYLIGQFGRALRCTSCGHQWHFRTDDEFNDTGARNLPDNSETRQIDEVNSAIFESAQRGRSPLLAFTPPSAPSKPAKTEKRRLSRGMLSTIIHYAVSLMGILAIVGLIIALLYLYVPSVKIKLQQWVMPLLISSTTTENGTAESLEIANVKFTRQLIDNKVAIVIEGVLFNPTERPLSVPMMTGLAIDQDGKDLLPGVSFALPEGTATPGQTIQFQTVMVNPPEGVKDFRIDFIR